MRKSRTSSASDSDTAAFAKVTETEDKHELSLSDRKHNTIMEPALDEEEQLCRVCRDGPTSDNPLYTPCLCSGSISKVHQECLLQWLEVSAKTECELCGHTFQMSPLYQDNAPSRLPVSEVMLELLKLVPMLLRMVLAGFLWLVLFPILICIAYRQWLFRYDEEIGLSGLKLFWMFNLYSDTAVREL